VPYEKGALFLRRIEELVGREEFDRFLNRYFDEHAFQSITTQDFLAYLSSELLDGRGDVARALDADGWINKPGLPDAAKRPVSLSLAKVDAEIERWKSGVAPADLATAGWVTQQWLHLLQALPKLTSAQMAAFDAVFRFSESGNSEIVCEWLLLAVRNGYAAADAKLESFLMHNGRRKFLKPLYTELAKTPDGLARAKSIYAKARPRYHAVSTGTIDGILGWK
jgi:hypothetical protein